MSGPTDALDYPFPDDGRPGVPAEFDRLRARCPVQRARLPYGGEGWLVSRHEDVKTVLGDSRFSRAATVDADIPRTTQWRTRGGNLMAMDPPDHSRVRRLVAGAFSRKAAQRLRPRTTQIVEELVSGMRAAGSPVDLVEHFSAPLPVTVICELLGVPFAQWHLFRDFSEKMFGGGAASAEEVGQATAHLEAFLREHVAARRAEPRDDLLSDIIRAGTGEDAPLTEHELVSLGVTILVAGHETTATAIANHVHALLTRGEWTDLAARPALVPTAVHELLRYVPIGGPETMPRVAVEDVEMAGTVVRAGETVFPVVGSANLDPAVFAEPDRLDLQRAANPHLTFGFGPHYCLGAQLAVMELEVGLGALLREFPGLRLAVPDAELRWRTDNLVRGPLRLPVAW
ncbi:cytochrome P450 [Pilimelia anulata]|uniref:Cytochrome P450 n=1 Tax=Pilimelia anulata TaxID=53371 RepID=A0A8J3BDW0_9ACTN|nr:cytochrome P450 [Pilimelia anulata]GGK00044.1 cytochrome P450 [Pilimelia anulata]